MTRFTLVLSMLLSCSGCAVLSIAGTVVATTVGVAGTVVETGVSVAGSAIRGVANAISEPAEKRQP